MTGLISKGAQIRHCFGGQTMWLWKTSKLTMLPPISVGRSLAVPIWNWFLDPTDIIFFSFDWFRSGAGSFEKLKTPHYGNNSTTVVSQTVYKSRFGGCEPTLPRSALRQRNRCGIFRELWLWARRNAVALCDLICFVLFLHQECAQSYSGTLCIAQGGLSWFVMPRSKVEVEGIEGAWPLHCNSTTLELAYPNPNPTTNTFFVLFVKVRIKKRNRKWQVFCYILVGAGVRNPRSRYEIWIFRSGFWKKNSCFQPTGYHFGFRNAWKFSNTWERLHNYI